MVSPWLWPWLLATGFAAGFVDAIAGGGGMITVPVLLGLGFSPAEALATNKLQATFGSANAVWAYRRADLVRWKEAWPGVVSTAMGAVSGVLSVAWMDAGLLRRVIPFLLLTAALAVALRPSLGAEPKAARLGRVPFLIGFGLVLGFYDGFFGPGTGTFWTLAFVVFSGFELLRATAWTKWMNFTSNIVSLAAFLGTARIDWIAGLWMGAGQSLGARLGARVAMRGGASVIRPVFLTVVLVATVKLFWDGWIKG
ncbi:MAG: TSUP family transporter [Limisphaerales bacterium]